MKWVAGVMCVLFVAAAAVQYNDPDPARWIAIYLLGALTAGLSAARRCPPGMGVAALGAFGLWALYMAPALAYFRPESVTQMHLGLIRDEEAREALGLLIGAAWSLALVLWNRSAGRPRPSPPSSAISEHSS